MVGPRRWELALSGGRVSVWEEGKVLEMVLMAAQYSSPLTHTGDWGANLLHGRKSQYNPSITPCTRFLHIRGSTSADSTQPRARGAVVSTFENNLRISGHMQLKPTLFKGQL